MQSVECGVQTGLPVRNAEFGVRSEPVFVRLRCATPRLRRGRRRNGTAFNAEHAENAEKDGNKIKADGEPKRGAPRGR